ncbi:DUF2207 domain-containing protein [Candidatus Saccharibacteria bacterium CPR2]|nr:DUF2207 domain-containing protein [Candidatus Saccharibacteria bacterium CPR2]
MLQKKNSLISFGLVIAAVTIFVALLNWPAGAISARPMAVKSFHGEYDISDQSYPHMVISETIKVVFNEPRHGIERYIPQKYKNTGGGFSGIRDLKTEIISVTDELGNELEFSERYQNDNLVLRIGDPDVYVTGEKTYVLSYSVENFVRFENGYDEIFMDVNGTGWDAEFDQVTAIIKLPEGYINKYAVSDAVCFTGEFGSTRSDCSVNLDDPQNISVSLGEGTRLSAYENLSFALKLESGYFQPPTFWQLWGTLIINAAIAVILPIFTLVYMIKFWIKHGKDPKGSGVIVTQFDAPNNLSPAHVGTLVDFSADNKELSSTIIDLAIKGYLKIIDNTEAKSKDYSFELVNDSWASLLPHEKEIMEGIFGEDQAQRNVNIKELKNKFYQQANSAKNQVYEDLKNEGYFANNPKSAIGKYIVIGIIIIFGGLFIPSFIFSGYYGIKIGLIASGVIIAIFGFFAPKRTREGVLASEHIKGLKRYMEVAEKDRIKMMQSPDSRYIGDVTAPEFTVELYEKLLPYAVVLGVEKQWAEKFKDIYTSPPSWYSGSDVGGFNSAVFTSHLMSSMNTINNTIVSSPSSSGSSGFGGGGSSGGGFGGGGGGSW